jgi:O-antigen/teichoic acid export membrane protein
MSLIKKLAGETAIYGVSSILSRLLNYVILTPYFTRVFLQGEYGEITNLYTYAAILMVLFTYRMETAFFRFGSRDNQMDKAFSTASYSIIISTIVFCVLISMFIEPISAFLNYPGEPIYIYLVLGIIALDALLAIPYARLRLENRPIRFAVLKTLHILINIVVIFALLEALPKLAETSEFWQGFYFPEDRVAYVFVANLVASGLVLFLLLPIYFKVRLVFDGDMWKQMMRYAMPLVIVGMAAVVNQLISYPLLENFLPGTLEENRAQMGVYSAAAKIAVLMNLFIQAFNYAAEPFFFNNAARSDSRLIYAQVGQAFALVGSVVFLGIMLYLDVVKYFIGPNLRDGLGVVPILLVAYFFLGLYYNFSVWFKLTDKTRFGAYISLGGVLITLIINLILIPNPAFGYYGAAWAALGCYAFMAFASYWTGMRHFPIPYPIRNMLAYLFVVLVLYGISQLIAGYLPQRGWQLGVNTILLFIAFALLYRFEWKSIQVMLRGEPTDKTT